MRFVRSALAAALLLSSGRGAPALVGPSEDGRADAPHVVMVLKSAPRGASFCTGVVVARDVVLTAAHCIGSPAQTRVHVRDGEGRPLLWPVASVALHPLYRADAIRTRQRTIDLALIRTAEPLPSGFQPVAIAAAPDLAVGTRLRIAGFGLTREGRPETSGRLRSGTLVVRAPLSQVLVWAEDPQKRGFGACTGDSGGPIFTADGDALVAITDWSAGPTRASHCGGLTQGTLVAPHRGWIAAVLARWGLR